MSMLIHNAMTMIGASFLALFPALAPASGEQPTADELTQPDEWERATIQVQFDMEGAWRADETRPMQCFRAETDVTCIMVNQGFSHRLDLVYTSPTQLQGTVTRRDRSNTCITHMNIVISMASASTFTLRWTALDSSCDLSAGQASTDPTYTRVS